jgi:predicted nucleic acid-binding Zn ribbon protein
LLCHRAMPLHANEQLALKSAEMVDLTSLYGRLKDEAVAEHAKVPLLAEEVRRLKAEADLRQEEMRLLKGNLQAVVAERDESRRQVAEASLCIDSLSKHLEVEP